MGRTFRSVMSVGAATALTASILTVGAVAATPVASANQQDDITGCDEVYDSAVVGSTPIQFMRIINEIPQQITVSRTSPGSVVGGRVTPAKVQTTTTPVWLGQKTPFMERGNTRDYKEFQSGSKWWTDHWFNPDTVWPFSDSYIKYIRHTVGCNPEMPFVVGPGSQEKAFANTYDYNGRLYGRNERLRGEGNWWAYPKNYSRDGVKGFHTWTCRGEVLPNQTNPVRASSVFWKKVDAGSGFYGDNDSHRTDRDAGRAPECQEPTFQNLSVRSNFAQTYYGNLPDDVRKSSSCEVDGARGAVGCWNEIRTGPWNNTWRQVTHVYAVALRAQLTSSARIEIPADYRDADQPSIRNLSWVITKADTTGHFPKGSAGLERNQVPEGSEVTPFTVPGGARADEYTIGTWGNVRKPEQKLTFRLTATTDGTWSWPVHVETGEPLVRPSVDLTFKFTLNDFDRLGTSCSGTNNGTGIWTEDAPCTIGLTPTIFQVGNDSRTNERRQPKLNDKGDPISTAEFKSEAIQGRWNPTDLKVQNTRFNWGSAGGAYVGANAVWEVNLSGTITNL